MYLALTAAPVAGRADLLVPLVTLLVGAVVLHDEAVTLPRVAELQ